MAFEQLEHVEQVVVVVIVVVVVVVVVVLGDREQEEVRVAGWHYAEQTAMEHEHCLCNRLLLDCHSS